jgi:hypothetical protein
MTTHENAAKRLRDAKSRFRIEPHDHTVSELILAAENAFRAGIINRYDFGVIIGDTCDYLVH